MSIYSCAEIKKEADLVVINANVYTVDDAFSKATAFAIQDGKFIAVGSTEEIQGDYTAPEVIDAKGRTITPGLIVRIVIFMA